MSSSDSDDNGSGPSRATIRRWLLDPALYAQHFLQHDVWDIPAAILRAVAAHENSRTSVKACHASSKTFSAAEAALWWVAHDERAIVVTTAPTWKQVTLTLWGEIGKAIATSLVAYPAPGRAQLWLARAGVNAAHFDNYAIGISTNEASRFQGFQRLKLLIIVDESAGVKPPIFEAIEGIRAGGDVRVLQLGNPTMVGGPYYDSFHKNRERFATFTIDALDTPNTRALGRTPDERLQRLLDAHAHGEHDVIEHVERSYLISRKFIVEKYFEWGIGSPQWDSRIRGQFPKLGEYVCYPLAWLERAARMLDDDDRIVGEFDTFDVGIDPAGPGKAETAVSVVHRPQKHPHVYASAGFPDRDARGAVLRMLAPIKARVRYVKVDTTGIGFYFAQSMRDAGYDVYEINAEDTPVFDRRGRFASRKAEMYWALRDDLEADELTGLVDEKQITQLSQLLWRENTRGRIMIQSKDEARIERGMPSPDRAESLILARAPIRPHATSEQQPTTVIRSLR